MKLGIQCCSLFAEFAMWIKQKCYEENIKQIFFFAREGIFFERVFSAIYKDFECKILYVSRLSTFFPSLDLSNADEWKRYSNQYGKETIEAFLCSLDISVSEVMPYLREYDLSPSDHIDEHIRAFEELLSSNEFRMLLSHEQQSKKTDLINYLSQEGLNNEHEKIAVVDIGWRGTIQDNICRLFPQTTFIGFYLGLIPFLNTQPKNSIKYGFINSIPDSSVFLKSLTQLEMLCSSDIGSVLRYEKRNNRMCPVMEANDDDIYSWNMYARSFQAGVLCSIDKTRRNDLRNLKRALMPLTLYPNRSFAKAFFRFKYSERFGLGQHVNQTETKSIRVFFRYFRSNKKILKSIRCFLNQTKWPQGYLVIKNMYLLLPIYNLILKIKSSFRRQK